MLKVLQLPQSEPLHHHIEGYGDLVELCFDIRDRCSEHPRGDSGDKLGYHHYTFAFDVERWVELCRRF